jgi:hypothetical protein
MSDVSSDTLNLARRVRERSGVALAQLQRLEDQHGPIRVRVARAADAMPQLGGNLDVEDLVLVVMMDGAKSAQDDLRSLLEEMTEVGKARERLDHNAIKRGTGGLDLDLTLQLLLTVYGKTIDENADALLGDLDSLREMSEMESLRLQMMMDRLSKMMTTLSNVMKKTSDINGELVQNIK